MASIFRLSFSDNTEQQSKTGRTRSWLFGGRRSKTGEAEDGSHSNNKKSTANPSYHKSSKSDEAKVDNVIKAKVGNVDEAKVGNVDEAKVDHKVLQAEKNKIISLPHEEEEEEQHYQVEEEAVDKEAEFFIEKMRSKMTRERMISMKRYESMINRGV